MPTHKQRERERKNEREEEKEREKSRGWGRGRQDTVDGGSWCSEQMPKCNYPANKPQFLGTHTHTLPAALIHTCTHSRTHSENGSESGHATSAKLGTKPEMPAHLVEPRTLEQAILLLLHSNCKALPPLPAPLSTLSTH